MKAWIISAVWVPISMRRLCTRSLIAPPRNEKSRIGPNWSAPMSPSRNGELVSSSTSHDWPTLCIHVPIRETSCPIQNSRKSR